MVGVPGAGKTTCLGAAFDLLGWARLLAEDGPFAHEMLVEDSVVVGAHLGKQRDGFGGTDALGMGVAPKVKRWLAEQDTYPLVVGEGDRLGTGSFLGAAMHMPDVEVEVVLLGCREETAAKRRAERGSTQNPSWLSGRLTKVRNLAPLADHTVDGNRPVEAVAADLAAIVARR